MKILSSKKGIAFFTTIVLLMLIVFIAAAITAMISRNSYTAIRMKQSMQAYFLAEAGIEEALKELNVDFNFAPSGYPKNLGEGTYSVTVAGYPSSLSRKLITSTGTVKSVTRSIDIQVRYTGPDAFNYPALGGGKLTIAGGTVVSDTASVTVHSNSPASSKAVAVGDAWGTGRVEGNASACGEVYVHPTNGTVTGSAMSYAPYVELPPFDDNFFQYYYNLAQADDNVKSGVVIFTSDPCTGKPNHVVYVNGQARLVGTWTMTGCVVATGKIIINKWASGRITINQWQNLPALMSKSSDVEIWDPTDIYGMVYAGGFIEIDSLFGSYGPTHAYGTLYGKSWVNIKEATELHYRRPNPPGLPGGPSGVEIVSWSGG